MLCNFSKNLAFFHAYRHFQFSTFITGHNPGQHEHSESKKQFFEWKMPEGYDTGVKVNNSFRCLGKKREHERVPLIVRNPKRVTWYTCGPTVYDDAHIGHASSYIRLDAIRRALTNFFDLEIVMAMGITNVDDKIISRAKLLDTEFLAMASHYEKRFKQDMEKLNVLPPTLYIRVSDVLPQIMGFVNKLLKNGDAYSTAKGNVWFNVDKFTQVGRLVPFNEDWVQSTDVDYFSDKQSKKDFALWKAAKPGEPYWPAPWGNGRPGWHVECSTMASLLFGDTIDIHTGGKDLCFPHHEYYLQTWTADGLRYFCLQTNWHSSLQYSEKFIEKAHLKVQKVRNFLRHCQQYVLGNMHGRVNACIVHQHLNECRNQVNAHLANDLDFAAVLAELEKLRNNVSKMFFTEIEHDSWDPDFEIRNPIDIMNVYKYMSQIYLKLGFTTLNASWEPIEDDRYVIGNKHKVSQKPSSNSNDNDQDLLNEWFSFRSSVRQIAFDLQKHDASGGKALLQLCDNIRDKMYSRNVLIKDSKKT
ncbi:putative cysteine--tRNA ligase, mitochondrial [Clavelina lepadiformis]|uniref:putative cysteine--tRNA ligase, mitochondrial n=1 Tax=Clavelina lepadiformis TaxID=159417 RepID=UPI004041E7D9